MIEVMGAAVVAIAVVAAAASEVLRGIEREDLVDETSVCELSVESRLTR